jgi:hypothetical protein
MATMATRALGTVGCQLSDAQGLRTPRMLDVHTATSLFAAADGKLIAKMIVERRPSYQNGIAASAPCNARDGLMETSQCFRV